MVTNSTMGGPKIISALQKKMVGMRIMTSLSIDDPIVLWKEFMPRRNEIRNAFNSGNYSIQIYPRGVEMSSFTPHTPFEKWAAVEVREFHEIPEGMEIISIPAGQYAVFLHKGITATFPQTMRYIFSDWLPSSGFLLDDRPHFEFMDERYLGPMNSKSEEEVWIPIH